jgi:AcrR family transcriptional regulator
MASMRKAPAGTKTPAAPRTSSSDVEAALIDAAERILVRDGPSAVTVRTVAAEAGVAPMGVYNRFHGKDGLVDALITRGFIELRRAVAGRTETDPIQRLRGSSNRYRQFALTHPARYMAMFDGAIHQEQTSPTVHEQATAAFNELVAHVQFGMEAGALTTADPTEVAQQIWSTVHGAVQLEIKGMLRVPDGERTYRQLFEALLRGLQSP